MVIISEGKATLNVVRKKIVSKDMPVFYNPVMELNRTLSVVLLNAINKKNMQIALPLAGSGVRGIRFLMELDKDKIRNITFNDYGKDAIRGIKANLKLNGLEKNKKLILENKDANLFLMESTGFDYIDIDPFGTPNPYLDSAVKRISREGILAVTATDTSSLSGTHVKACLRKYWAKPLRTEIMHEIGVRILIRKCQLIGAQFDKALIPIFSYSRDHYMRVFFRCEKGKEKVDSIIRQHGLYEDSGPMWLGALWDEKLVGEMKALYLKIGIVNKSIIRLLTIIQEESKMGVVGFYHIPSFVKKNGLKVIPTQSRIIEAIRKKGFKCSETHFKDNSLRTNISEKDFKKILIRIS